MKINRKIFAVISISLSLIIMFFLVNMKSSSFDLSILDENNIYDIVKEISSDEYKGRLTGSEGNVKALKYIEDYFLKLGLKPAGDNNSFYQDFKAIVPNYDESTFEVYHDNSLINEFILYKDYNVKTNGTGGRIDFEGEILVVDGSVRNVEKEFLKDRVIAIRDHGLREGLVDYLMENGVKGILFNDIGETSELIKKKLVDTNFKSGQTIFYGDISSDTYRTLKGISTYDLVDYSNAKGNVGLWSSLNKIGRVSGVKLKHDLNFNVTNTQNLLGKIDGTDDGYLIISAHIDHLGEGENGEIFNGAIDNASGIGVMLELARVLSEQDIKPEKTIIFAAWNGKENGLYGSKYYVENPLYPLEETEVIVLDSLGNINHSEIKISSGSLVGNILKDKIIEYSIDIKQEYIEGREFFYSDHYSFLYNDVPAIVLYSHDVNRLIHKSSDNIENINLGYLKNSAMPLLNYIQHDVYKDGFLDYLSNFDILIIALLILGYLVIYLLNNFYKNKINNLISFNIFTKAYFYVVTTLIILFILVFISHIPKTFNLIFRNDKAFSNFSIYTTLKSSINYLKTLFTSGLGSSMFNISVLEVIKESFYKSFKLIFGAVILSFVLGTTKGILDGRSDKGLRGFSTLVFLSLPDVLIAILIQLLIINMYKSEVFNPIIKIEFIKKFIMPMIALSIIPTTFIARITYTIINDEKNKTYVKAAKARGLSRFIIFKNHILKSIIIKIVDMLPSITTILISNLIIVEYLFWYKGIIYNLLYYKDKGDVITFVGLAISVGLLYICINLLFKATSKIINPLKGEGYFEKN